MHRESSNQKCRVWGVQGARQASRPKCSSLGPLRTVVLSASTKPATHTSMPTQLGPMRRAQPLVSVAKFWQADTPHPRPKPNYIVFYVRYIEYLSGEEQCEDLYELISCLLPEVTASPAQHCTYSIFGTKLSRIRPSLFTIFAALLGFLCEVRGLQCW
jgi:hypothetical protein